jgi:hypothetical protein
MILMVACVSWAISGRNTKGATEEFVVNGLKVLVQPVTAGDIICIGSFCGGCMNLTEATGYEPLIFLSALKGSNNIRS